MLTAVYSLPIILNSNKDEKNRPIERSLGLFYKKEKNQPNNMVACPYFTTNYLELSSDLKCNNTKDSFVIYMCVDGFFDLYYNKNKQTVLKGETIFLPAQLDIVTLKTHKKAIILEIYF